MSASPVFTVPYQWSLSHINRCGHPLPGPYLAKVFAVFERALGLLVGLVTLPFTWSWYQLGRQFPTDPKPPQDIPPISALQAPGAVTPSSHARQSLPSVAQAIPSMSMPQGSSAVTPSSHVRQSRPSLAQEALDPQAISSISTLQGPGALDAARSSPALQQSLQLLAQALEPHEDVICDDISMSRYFSQLPLNLAGKKIVIYCKDAGGFGDYMFGFKLLNILKQYLPGVIVALATDNPKKALKLNESPEIQILMPEENRVLPLNEVVSLIDNFACDFFIMGPVTWMNPVPFQNLMHTRPHLCIREYGFTAQVSFENDDEYISGPAKPFVGMLVHEPLMQWASLKEDRLDGLKHLEFLTKEICREILQQDFSEDAIQNFAQNSFLFGCYGSSEETKVRFLLSIATEFYQHLGVNQELCFFFFGSCNDRFLELVQQHLPILQNLKIGTVEFVNLNVFPHTLSRHTLNAHAPRKIRCIFSSLQPSDTALIFKASEKEIQTTGDQSWSEGVSAKKHWIQERLIHKAEYLKGVLALSKELADTKKGAFVKLDEHLQRIYARRGYRESIAGYEDQALLLAESRQHPELSQAWDVFNQSLLENNIRHWVVGKIIWEVLKTAYPQDFDHLQHLMGRTVKGEELQRFFQELASK